MYFRHCDIDANGINHFAFMLNRMPLPCSCTYGLAFSFNGSCFLFVFCFLCIFFLFWCIVFAKLKAAPRNFASGGMSVLISTAQALAKCQISVT